MTRTVLLALWLWGATATAAESLPLQNLSVVRSDGVRVELVVELASSEAQRRSGLMGRRALAARAGMLFDFHTSMTVTMWMKDTPLSLDMLFIDAAGQVVWINERTAPESPALISAPQPVRFVLELASGEVRRWGLAVGDRVVLPGSAAAVNAERRPRL